MAVPPFLSVHGLYCSRLRARPGGEGDTLHLSQHRGLVVAEQAVDERAVARALKALDDRLILAQEFDPRYECVVYAVVRYRGSERDADHICDWRDEYGVPLPLSMRLVDKADSLRADSRAPQIDVLAANDALLAAQRRELDDAIDEAVRAHTNRGLRFFMGDLRLDPLKIRAARLKGEGRDIE